jgi:hypothetical protein
MERIFTSITSMEQYLSFFYLLVVGLVKAGKSNFSSWWEVKKDSAYKVDWEKVLITFFKSQMKKCLALPQPFRSRLIKLASQLMLFRSSLPLGFVRSEYGDACTSVHASAYSTGLHDFVRRCLTTCKDLFNEFQPVIFARHLVLLIDTFSIFDCSHSHCNNSYICFWCLSGRE